MNTDGFSRNFLFLEEFGTQTLFLKWQLCLFNYKSPQLVSKCLSWKPSLTHAFPFDAPPSNDWLYPQTVPLEHYCFLFGRHIYQSLFPKTFLNKCKASRHKPTTSDWILFSLLSLKARLHFFQHLQFTKDTVLCWFFCIWHDFPSRLCFPSVWYSAAS